MENGTDNHNSAHMPHRELWDLVACRYLVLLWVTSSTWTFQRLGGLWCWLLLHMTSLGCEIRFIVPKFKPQHTTHPQIPTVLSYKMSPVTEISQFLCAFCLDCCNEQLCSGQKTERSFSHLWLWFSCAKPWSNQVLLRAAPSLLVTAGPSL